LEGLGCLGRGQLGHQVQALEIDNCALVREYVDDFRLQGLARHQAEIRQGFRRRLARSKYQIDHLTKCVDRHDFLQRGTLSLSSLRRGS
jgi:hypothetical protein